MVNHLPPEHEKPFVVVAHPTREVQKFLRENPEVGWRNSLTFLLDRYPQVEKGRVIYLIEGGAAIRLLHPERQEPGDVDVITRSSKMARDFANAQKIDVKTVSVWFAHRLWPYNYRYFNPKPGEFLLDLNQIVNFEGREIVILNSLGLAASKMLAYGNRPPRDKDLEDLKLLKQDPARVQEVIDRIKIAYPAPEI